ncbi:MAG: precorrin-3B C(17)-methyltransferase [Tissierellia bacterium]|nr:precorrin-3B C(17)-methyltransferase [Tissierellia bacterium]
MGKLYVIGIGPGGQEYFTEKALTAIKESNIIVGYTPYIEYLGDLAKDKEIYSTGMKSEIERCEKAISLAREGNIVSIVSTGDAGLYGMAGPILERSEGVNVEVVPGVSANFAAAAYLGAPIMHDFATISLSDLLTPWEVIVKRVKAARDGDFVICFYNPRSKGRKDHLEKMINLLLEKKAPKTPVGIVKDAGRKGTKVTLTTLDSIDYEEVDMLTTVIVGNSKTFTRGELMITPRGYENK